MGRKFGFEEGWREAQDVRMTFTLIELLYVMAFFIILVPVIGPPVADLINLMAIIVPDGPDAVRSFLEKLRPW